MNKCTYQATALSVILGLEPLTGYIDFIDFQTALIKAEFSCELCQMEFDNEKTTADHMKQHNPSKYCMRCKFAAPSTSESCSLCSETLSNYSQGACCAICKYCFEDIEQLKSHILLHTRVTSKTGHSMTSKHICALCRGWFKKSQSMRHMKHHCPVIKELGYVPLNG